MFFCWSGQGIWILSKLTQNWRRYWKWHNGKYTMRAERKHGSTQIWIFNCKSEDWKLVVQYEEELHWVAHWFLQRENNRRQICYQQLFTQRNRMVFLFQCASKRLIKIENALEFSSNSKISWGRDWRNSKSIIYIPEYFGFQNCGSEITEEDISNIDGIKNVIERRYSGADTTDEEFVGYFHNILQNEQLLWPPESWADAVKIFDTLMEYN